MNLNYIRSRIFSLLETPIAWLRPTRFLASLHQRQHYHEMFHVTKFQFDNEGVPNAHHPPQIGMCPSTCPSSQNFLAEALFFWFSFSQRTRIMINDHTTLFEIQSS